MANGNLSPVEYEERAGKAVVAKTFGELDDLTDDLPVAQLGVGAPASDTHTRPAATPSGRPPVRNAIAIMSGSEVGGNAAVAEDLNAVAIMGGVEIDLREVEFTSPTLTIRATAIMGGVEITVPPDVTVEIGGSAIMGGFNRRAAGRGAPGAPIVSITGFALMGGVEVKRKPRKS
ncbi:hypothetical protein GS4_34_00960 [Gordonia soli NBRC 108243]|uniref:Uncharacterized protein n=2 Tax=Gordonia soli TaxID=320799 RepID=M0QP44_9ACTN|nr:hypothetical protein GS4_34_00960 [Gordonia soli NBRC 108243]